MQVRGKRALGQLCLISGKLMWSLKHTISPPPPLIPTYTNLLMFQHPAYPGSKAAEELARTEQSNSSIRQLFQALGGNPVWETG
jgi:hypothetical protein